ncbi:hypothetical protein EZJ19_15000 [Parasulfuritortus cantonensis]|uniref:Lipoprotein n=1 Tax=Parasulfuritortus cantonensis TaxID=2528202 RepID=A0A4R1B0S1_9PROT|nr:hypothetical protein [Parasulfuritortus cantonensis]TCJ11582.1 hypothetical protein EZJ19_15000 [Parasulfuritortus cantonensis]
MNDIARRILIPALCAGLAGCGVETAGTAAVAAKAGQEEVEQGKRLEQDLTDKLNAASEQERQRLDQAAEATK